MWDSNDCCYSPARQSGQPVQHATCSRKACHYKRQTCEVSVRVRGFTTLPAILVLELSDASPESDVVPFRSTYLLTDGVSLPVLYSADDFTLLRYLLVLFYHENADAAKDCSHTKAPCNGNDDVLLGFYTYKIEDTWCHCQNKRGQHPADSQSQLTSSHVLHKVSTLQTMSLFHKT